MSNYKDEIRAVLAKMDNQENQHQQQTNPQTPPDQIQDVYVYIVREHEVEEEDQAQVVDSTPPAAPDTKPPHASAPVSAQPDAFLSAYIFVCFSIVLVLATLTFQLYCMFNPPIAIVTIIPKSQLVTLNGTLELGRLLPPITISQSAATPTTGHGHQDARAATGYITFYNGQFQSVSIAAGTILQGSSGIQIVTDQDVTIPAGNPPSYGQVSVSAHAVSLGSRGNIAAYDINQIYANAILVKNTSSFSGGQDERNFQTVAKTDIFNAATPLKATLKQSIQGAWQGQLKPSEQLALLPCSPIISSNHKVGDEATQVKVTLSETCSAAAYDTTALQTRATQLLTTQVYKKLGSGYILLGEIHVSVRQATVNHTPTVFLSFHASGTWMYVLSYTAQQQIKSLIAGKSKVAAVHLLLALPSMQQVAIAWGEDRKLRKNVNDIHLQISMHNS